MSLELPAERYAAPRSSLFSPSFAKKILLSFWSAFFSINRSKSVHRTHSYITAIWQFVNFVHYAMYTCIVTAVVRAFYGLRKQTSPRNRRNASQSQLILVHPFAFGVLYAPSRLAEAPAPYICLACTRMMQTASTTKTADRRTLGCVAYRRECNGASEKAAATAFERRVSSVSVRSVHTPCD